MLIRWGIRRTNIGKCQRNTKKFKNFYEYCKKFKKNVQKFWVIVEKL